jgi:branched-chain amino acid transport system permease protein
MRPLANDLMTDFLQLVLSGLATGAIYALAALGFTLLWQASGTVNFAQGEFVMLPAFAMLAFASFGLPLPLSFLATCVLAVVVLGWGFKRGIADPLLKFGLMPIVVATIGLAIALRNGVRAGYTAQALPFPSLFADRVFNVAGVAVSLADAGTLAIALALVLGTQAFLARTVTGRAMQAVAQNPESATVIGIDVPRMVFYTFALNAVLACAAALLVAPTWLVKFDMGESLGTKAFFAAIIGGFNNSRGALLGGIVVGVCENLAAAYVSPAYKDAVALVVFMAVILFKPEGLLGQRIERKV